MMACSFRLLGVVLGVLLGLSWAGAALAQCTGSNATTLQLTTAGSGSGFGLSTFACGFPTFDGAATGPTGSVGTGAGNVLATDANPEDTVSFNPATCISDGGCNINGGSSGEYTNFTHYTVPQVTLGAVTTAWPGDGNPGEFSVDTANMTLDNVATNGTSATNISGNNLGNLAANEVYAVATMPLTIGGGNGLLQPASSSQSNFTCSSANNAQGYGCYLPGDLLVLGNAPSSANGPGGPGIYDYNGLGLAVYQGNTCSSNSDLATDPPSCNSVEPVIPDSVGGLDALAVSNDGTTIYVGSDTSLADAIQAFNSETGAVEFSLAQTAFGGGVTGLYVLQTGDLMGDLLVDTAASVDLYCTNSNYGCTAGDIITLATGGSNGGTIGVDYNLNTNPRDCGGATNVDEYTCDETVYLSQSATLDQLTYSGGPVSSAVPEPASLTLFAAGLAGLCYLRRRKAAA
jgi:hypothetical protein